MKRTYKPSTLVAKRRHGFLTRAKKQSHILTTRKLKNRKYLSK